MSGIEFSFDESLVYGQQVEKVVFSHLSKKKEAITVVDYSQDKEYQSLGIDGMYIYENLNTGIMHSIFFDVKMASQMHKLDSIFIETNSNFSETEKIKDGILSTKAEYFLYYDPVLGRLLWLPVYAFREWYKAKGISKVHVPVKTKGVGGVGHFTTEGIVMTISELRELFPFIELELELPKLSV